MRKKIKPGSWSILGIAVFLISLTLFSCSSNTTTIRIKTDKGRSMKEEKVTELSDQPLNQRVLPMSSEPKKSKEEILAVQVNQVLNHYVKAEDLIAEGKLEEAEKEMLLASSILESKENWSVLIKIYEQAGQKTKADSCRKLMNSFNTLNPSGKGNGNLKNQPN